MSLDKATVARIAKLARLKIEPSALEPMAGELNRILSFVEQLNELKTSDVPPLTSTVAMQMRMRDDVVNDGGNQEAVLRNAPAREGEFYSVPKVVE